MWDPAREEEAEASEGGEVEKPQEASRPDRAHAPAEGGTGLVAGRQVERAAVGGVGHEHLDLEAAALQRGGDRRERAGESAVPEADAAEEDARGAHFGTLP